MLEPSSRSLFTQSLRPPAGFRFDCAVATTFSLDLVAMMTAPMAFTFYDCEDADGENISDPLPLLEAVRRHASNITVFCHAGRISLPNNYRPLFTYLEDSVIECLPKGERGAFHPKVWALRYFSDEGLVAYRLLVLSRNLTFDRSWDVSLQLDGVLTKRSRPTNKPLADFVKLLPSLARRELSQERLAQVKLISSELRKVEWDRVDGFDEEMVFWPLGLSRTDQRPLQGRIDKLLVISPFVNDGFWDVAGGTDLKRGSKNSLVARPEEIDAMGEDAAAFGDLFVLEQESLATEDDTSGDAGSEASQPRGLHAKVFVADAGWKARWWVGSANATDAAFTRNVEFLVELTGPINKLGTRALLDYPGADDRRVTLRSLLEEYTVQAQDAATLDAAALEHLLEDARYALGRAAVVAQVVEQSGEDYELVVTVDTPKSLKDVEVFVRPLSVPQGQLACIGQNGGTATFKHLAIEMLSPFIVFEVRAAKEGVGRSCSFVRRVELLNAPAGRQEAAIRSVLRNKSEVMRYLLFLLAAEGADGMGAASAAALMESEGDSLKRTLLGSDSLLESLARSLSSDPARILSVKRLVDELMSAGSTDLLPERFEDIWMPIWTAYQQSNGAAE